MTAKIFENRFLRVTGILGFSWYLLHFPVFQFLNFIREKISIEFPAENLVFFVAAWVICGAVSWIGFNLIEKPGISLGRSFCQRVENRSASL